MKKISKRKKDFQEEKKRSIEMKKDNCRSFDPK